MTLDYGIKVSKPGYPVTEATPPQLIFSSKYQTFRVQQQGSGTITHTGGRTHTIAHNLGYVPAFIVHSDVASISFGVAGAYYPLPFSQSYGLYMTQYNEDILVWADSTNLYIKAQNDFGYKFFDTNDVAEEDATGYWRDYFGFGRDMPTWGTMHGAMRFGSVTVAKNATIYEAVVGIHVGTRYGSSNLYSYMWGIDEDNTGDFGSNPLGRTKTDARGRPEANPSSNSDISFGCTAQLQEVVNRGGWSSGNNFGLLFRQEGPDGESPVGNGFLSGSTGHYLKVLDVNTLLNYKYTIFKDKIV